MNEANEIDDIREAFEAAWLTGSRPNVEEFASRVAEPLRQELLGVLIPLDIRYRRKQGEPIEVDDYASLGPMAVELVRGELHASAAQSKPPRFVVLEETVASKGTELNRDKAPGAPSPESTSGRVQYFGEYELLSEIARGGMGVVYKARQSKLNRIVALKMILSGEFTGEQELKRFQAEAEAAAKLDHPGLVPIFEIGEHEGRHFIAMAYVEGRSLATKLREEGPMRPKDAAGLVRKITDAVRYAHSKGVIHRDLKPGNVLLDANDEPRVTDFGLAKQINTDSELTATGQVLGTPSYMPPEQADARQGKIGPASDVYSIGAILYTCLTGRPPFQGASATDVILQVLRDPPPAPRTLNRKVDRDLNTIVMKCLDKPIGGRYPQATNLRVDLDRYLRGQSILARPVGPILRTYRWSMRHKAMSAVLAALFVSLSYPLAIGVADLFRNRAVITQLASVARGSSGDIAAGYVKRMQMINDEGEVESAFATVVPGIRSMRMEEVEEIVEAACNEAIVLRLVSGSDSMTHYRTGARVEIAVELEKDGKVQTLFSADWDMRAAVDAPVAKIGTLTFLRHERQEDGSEHWDFKQTLQQKRVTSSNSKETNSKSLLAEYDSMFQSNLSQSSSSGYSYGRGVDVWSEPVNMTLDQRLERIESLVGLSDEERKVFTEEFVSGLSFGSSHSGATGIHTEVEKEITLYEASGGSLLHLNYLRKKHNLPEKAETPDAIIRVKCRMLRDSDETEETAIKNPTQEALEEGVLVTTTKARSYFDRGYASYGAKKYAAAVKDLSQAIENRVKLQDSYHFRAHCYMALGEYEPALSDIQWLTRYVPNKSHYQDMMSEAFHGLGRDEEAKQVALKSIELQEAAVEKNATERNKSDLASSLNALAWTLATYPRDSIRDGAEAVKLATRACELTGWSKWHYLDTLAAAYAEAGDFSLAVEWLGKTLEALPESDKAKSLDELESRLRLFKSGEAYRDGESVE